MRSIERLLLQWVLGALSLGAIALVIVSYALTLQELDEVFDENLKQVAIATASHHQFPDEDTQGPAAAASAASMKRPALPALARIYDNFDGFIDFDFVTLAWSKDGVLNFTSDPKASLPFRDETGLTRIKRADGTWHIYTIVRDDGVVQAAQRGSSRETLAAEVASKMFLPLAGLVVLIGILLVFALRRGLRSLDHAAASVANRSTAALDPVPLTDMPREIFPLIGAINGLLARLAVAFANQRRFVADAAHELRTPVTAVRLQLQLLERAGDEAARARAIADLKAGVARSQHLIEQLLLLSRVEPEALETPFTEIDLGGLVREVVGGMSVEAEHHGVDLGADTAPGTVVQGDREQLTVLLNNLVGNALRHTPQGGVVDVKATHMEGRAALLVIDDGPGIPESERRRVFDRFYRGAPAAARPDEAAGSGLGLAIVRVIAGRHGAGVSLHTPGGGRGLEVRVVFGSGGVPGGVPTAPSAGG